jgi:HKD family nuclease
MEILGLYANRNSNGDFVENAIQKLTDTPSNVYVAVAFFTEADVIESMIAKGNRVRLIVRLGFPTSPKALQRLLNNEKVEIRYFTSHSFHPKVYLFGDRTALVGSANLTRAAILTNQEVVVSIDAVDPRFNELALLFADYWSQAKVLTEQALKDYAEIYAKFEKLQNEMGKLEATVVDKLGEVVAGNITRGKVKVSKESIFLEDFRKTYQEGVRAFNVIRDVYEKTGYRKAQANDVPLRIEIDSFISFVRNKFAIGELWQETPIRTDVEQEQFILEHIEAWKATEWPHFENTIVGENYPLILKTLGTIEAINSANDDQLFEALTVLHSFYDRLRFYESGLPTWKRVFLKSNEPQKLREVLVYLIHGTGNIEVRMANVIFNPELKLNQFGQSNVQELIGWLNKEDYPVINGRTTKILRYFGSNVRQL